MIYYDRLCFWVAYLFCVVLFWKGFIYLMIGIFTAIYQIPNDINIIGTLIQMVMGLLFTIALFFIGWLAFIMDEKYQA
jgi:hypothetical protein